MVQSGYQVNIKEEDVHSIPITHIKCQAWWHKLDISVLEMYSQGGHQAHWTGRLLAYYIS